jgi:hypothetical protein
MPGMYEVCLEMVSRGTKYIPSFTKIGLGIQAILILCLISLRGCNVGITDERDL